MNLKASKKVRNVSLSLCSEPSSASSPKGARSNRNKLARNSNASMASDYEVKYALAEELLGACMVILRGYGLDLMRLQDLRTATHGPNLDVPTAQRLFDDLVRLSELVNQWA